MFKQKCLNILLFHKQKFLKVDFNLSCSQAGSIVAHYRNCLDKKTHRESLQIRANFLSHLKVKFKNSLVLKILI